MPEPSRPPEECREPFACLRLIKLSMNEDSSLYPLSSMLEQAASRHVRTRQVYACLTSSCFKFGSMQSKRYQEACREKSSLWDSVLTPGRSIFL